MKYSAITIYLVAIISLTICVTADGNLSGNNPISIDNQKGLESQGLNQDIAGPITGSKRAEMLVPFSKVSKDDFVIDVSEGSTQYIDGAVSIPYMNFFQDKKPRSNEEISRILRDAGVPCDRTIYIYGECIPCQGKSNPAAFAYLILESLGYQVRLLDGNLEQWRASGGHVSDRPAIKPKTNCTPAVNSGGIERGNQTRIATGNGSRTDGGFAGDLTSGIVNPNGALSEEVPYTFEANSTPAQDLNDTVRHFENVVNGTISMTDNSSQNEDVEMNLSDDDYPYPQDTASRLSDPTKYPLYPYDRAEFYHRWNRLLSESASGGKPLTDRQNERINRDWDHAQEAENIYINSRAKFYQRFSSLLMESTSSGKPLTDRQIKEIEEIWKKVQTDEDTGKINTPNSICGLRS